GSISVDDVDGADTATVTAPAGALGTLVLTPVEGGGYTYTYTVANSAVQYLGTGQTKTETFTITTADGTEETVEFTIHGANEPIPPVDPGPTNRAPTLATPLADQSGSEGGAFTFGVPAGAFTDPDGDALSYSATLEDGVALPAWLIFNPATREFTATPAHADIGTLNVVLTAADGRGGTVTDTFAVTITAAGGGIGDITLSEANVDENSAAGTVVGDLAVPGAAVGAITYTLTDSQDTAFAIVDGKLVVAEGAKLDFETGALYTIEVEATDAGGTVYQQTFDIDINDVLENPKGTPAKDRLIGDAFDNRINGRASNDVLKGMDGDDRLSGGRGNDRLIGGDGADTFVFSKFAGRDVVKDFHPEEGDVIDLGRAVGIDSFRDLMKHHVEERGDNVVITADNGATMVIKHMALDDLKESDFLF
ncbi:VCBS domain-containing protein, partial [Rhizobium sp. KVB221]